MIDSISLQLRKGQYKLNPINKFDGLSIKKIKGFSSKTMFCKSYNKALKDNHIYLPMIEIVNKVQGSIMTQEELNIQASLGKLLYGSNVFGVDEGDLKVIYKRILIALNSVGVQTSINEIKQAIIRKVDYSIVIIIPTYFGTIDIVIQHLFPFNYKFRSEFDYMRFKKGGSLIRFANRSQKYTAYDKIEEIFNHGYTKTENTIMEAISSGTSKRNLLKFELSFLRKDSFKKSMRVRIGKKKEYYLEDILKLDLARNILLDIFDSVYNYSTVKLISLSEMKDNELWLYLINSKLTQKQRETLFYWSRMATKNGIDGAFSIIKQTYKGGSVARKKKEITSMLQKLDPIDKNTPNLINFLRNAHKEFKIIKPKRNVHL